VSRHVGRVKIHRGTKRATSAPDMTTAMPRQPGPAPVFVDDSGRRRRRVRLIIIGLCVLLLAVVAVIWWNQSAEPVRPAPIRTCAPLSTESCTEQ
jgi:hypothetical protein